MNHIVESIGYWGVRTAPVFDIRLRTPKSGDYVQFSEELRRYPVSREFCRISHVNTETGRIGIVDGDGSAFLREDGSVDVSGGPFFGLFLEDVEPLGILHPTNVWNFPNGVGAGMGVHYRIDRPLFRALVSPGDLEERIATSEEHARQGGMFGRSVIPEFATLYRVIDREGVPEKEFWFNVRQPQEIPHV